MKKFVSLWLMPLPVVIVLLVAGLLLLRSARRATLARRLIFAATCLLLIFGNKAISMALIRPLETIYPAVPEFTDGEPIPVSLAACRYVVVLGGGHGDTDGLSATNKLSTSSRGRLMEGLRLLQALPAAKLVTSGRGAQGQPSHAAVVAQAALSLGLEASRVIRLDTPRDTEEEAQVLRHLLGEEPFALVTSAWHMRRAAALMKAAGLHPVPCPADYSVRPGAVMNWSDLGWDSDSLGRSKWAISERIGYAWSWLRNKV